VVVWTKPALIDLRDIHDHIAKDSSYYAKKVVQEIRQKADIANDFPLTSKVLPEIGDPAIREFHIYSYRIIYEINQDETKQVLAVIHQRQNFQSGDLS